jgi:RND family efflux transporter MFP subunit
MALVVLSAASLLAGCRGSRHAPGAPPPPRVTVIQPAAVPVRDFWTYNGYLESTKEVEVRSKVRGFLTDVNFVEGTEVAEKTTLYQIDKVEFKTAVTKAEAELKKAEADIIKSNADIENWKAQIIEARLELDRVKRAVASGSEAETTLTKQQATYDVRIAELEAAKATRDAMKATRDAAAAALHSAEIQLGYTDIKAKIGGRISRTMVHEGNLVQADTTLLTTIVKVDELFVYFDAPEADLVAFQEAMMASRHKDPVSGQIPVEVAIGKEGRFAHGGRIDFRENRVDTATGTIRIRGRIDNPLCGNNTRVLFPGMFVRVRVPKGEPTTQLALPEDCLLNAQEGQFVLVVGPDNKVQKRLVTVGATVWKAPSAGPGDPLSKWVAINPHPQPADGKPQASTRRPIRSVVTITFHKPLQADERVILDGLQKAKPGDAVDPEEWNLTPDDRDAFVPIPLAQ